MGSSTTDPGALEAFAGDLRKNRLALSGRVVPANAVVEVGPLVEWQLRLRGPRERRLARRVSLATFVWLAGGLAVNWSLQGRWPAAFLMVYVAGLMLVVEAHQVWQTARMRRTAEVNGWLVNGQVADAS